MSRWVLEPSFQVSGRSLLGAAALNVHAVIVLLHDMKNEIYDINGSSWRSKRASRSYPCELIIYNPPDFGWEELAQNVRRGIFMFQNLCFNFRDVPSALRSRAWVSISTWTFKSDHLTFQKMIQSKIIHSYDKCKPSYMRGIE